MAGDASPKNESQVLGAREAPATAPLLGERLSGRRGAYELDQFLGRGGMGEVWGGRELHSGRTVAVKTLHARFQKNLLAQERFKREAVIGYCLTHSNLVQVLDAGGVESTPLFFVMERLRGTSLGQYIHLDDTQYQSVAIANASTEDSCPNCWKFRTIIYVARGLAMLHAHGIIHRDVAPGNIFMPDSVSVVQEPKLMDYGIAKQECGPNITRHHETFGNRKYMAPEQALDSGNVDERSDLWSLAAVLFDLLGVIERPEDCRDLDPNRPPSGLSRDIWCILARALRYNRGDRYSSVREFAQALEPFAGGLTYDSGCPTVPVAVNTYATTEQIELPAFDEIAARLDTAASGSRGLRWTVALGCFLAGVVASAIFYWIPSRSTAADQTNHSAPTLPRAPPLQMSTDVQTVPTKGPQSPGASGAQTVAASRDNSIDAKDRSSTGGETPHVSRLQKLTKSALPGVPASTPAAPRTASPHTAASAPPTVPSVSATNAEVDHPLPSPAAVAPSAPTTPSISEPPVRQKGPLDLIH